MERRTLKEVEVIYSEQAEIMLEQFGLSKDEFETEGLKFIKVGDRTITEFVLWRAMEEKKKILKLGVPKLELVK